MLEYFSALACTWHTYPSTTPILVLCTSFHTCPHCLHSGAAHHAGVLQCGQAHRPVPGTHQPAADDGPPGVRDLHAGGHLVCLPPCLSSVCYTWCLAPSQTSWTEWSPPLLGFCCIWGFVAFARLLLTPPHENSILGKKKQPAGSIALHMAASSILARYAILTRLDPFTGKGKSIVVTV